MLVFELIMIICFGVSWPFSLYKSIKSKSTKGKSAIFLIAVIIGYASGIIGKIVNDNITYVFVFYCINLCMVALDLVFYFINRRNEKKLTENK